MVLMVLFAACTEKEGVYNPKKKIAKIYTSSVSHYGRYDPETGTLYNQNTFSYDKQLSEEWTWDGNKLSKITVYPISPAPNDQERGHDDIHFTYDGNQIQRIESENEYMTFTYDGKKLQQIQLFSTGSSNPFETYTFTHEGNKVTKVVFAFEDLLINKTSVNQMKKILFRFILPSAEKANKALATLQQAAAKGSADGMVSIPMELTWTGDNVTGINANYLFPGMTGPEARSLSATFEFDDKCNPFKNNFLLGMNDGSFSVFNENNMTKSTTITRFGDGYPFTDEITYSYTYDNQWPLTQTAVTLYHAEDYGSIDSTTLYFEYVK